MDENELLSRKEAHDFEAKSAQGRFGDGTIPDSLWETYSAMANTDGGYMVLGAEEKEDGSLTFLGLGNVRQLQSQFWNSLNNKEIVNANILRNEDVEVVEVNGKDALVIHVPRAPRQQRPVYVGQNPLAGTYRRNYEGDYRCDEPTVRRMMAEATQDSRDVRILQGFDLDDIEQETLDAYRNEFKSTRPGHPWITLGDRDFLRQLGGWKKDRRSGDTGLTLAGVLMFGGLRSILDAVPNYILDYQERSGDASDGLRWEDRITTDGSWSGNLFDFYRRVYPRLTSDVKVPFRLEGAQKRVDETHVHKALREALINTLIHADYEGRVGTQIIKLPDRFRFRNSGGLRVSTAQAKEGGISDCRNRNLQKMFQLIGAGEQAGSGFPKILRAWRDQHWRNPILRESFDPGMTVLELPLMSLVPEEALGELQDLFGHAFNSLQEIKRLALATALVEGQVTNQRLSELTDEHPRDITDLLRELVEGGFLKSKGTGRGTYYVLPAQQERERDTYPSLFDWSSTSTGGIERLRSTSSTQTDGDSSQHSGSSSQQKAGSTQHSKGSTQHSKALKTKEQQHRETWDELMEVARPVRETGRAPAGLVESTIAMLCADRYLTIQQLSKLLDRGKDTLRNHYLNPMVKSNMLKLRYPDKLTDPRQAYKTVPDDTSTD